MTELTEQQQQALDANPVPHLMDPRTKKNYVLLEAETYERIRGLLGECEDLTMPQVAILVERAMREEDANDPTLAFYQEKYGKKT